MNEEQLIEHLSQIIDRDRILEDISDRYSYSYDASFGTYLPDVVVQPTSALEVSHIMKLANKHLIPVYPRGQGTSLSGGPLPVKGGIVLDLSQWKDRLDVYPDDMVAVVSPGVLTAAINEAAMAHGLMYPLIQAALMSLRSEETLQRIQVGRAD